MHEAMLPCREAAKNAEEDNSVTELYLQAGPDSPVERARVDLLEQVQLAFALGNSALESRAGVPTLEYMLQSFAPGDGLDSTASCARRGSLREGEARLAAWPCICRPACVPVPAQPVHRKTVWLLTSSHPHPPAPARQSEHLLLDSCARPRLLCAADSVGAGV